MQQAGQTPTLNSYSYYGYGIAKSLDGGYIVAGRVLRTTYDISHIKIDSEGDTVWTKIIITANHEEALAIAACIDSGFIITGYKNNTTRDMIVYKVDSRGDTEWSLTIDENSAAQEGHSIVQNPVDSTYTVCSYTTLSSAKNMLVVNISQAGTEKWRKSFGGPYDEEANSICLSETGGYMIAGYTKTYSDNSNGDAMVISLEADGDSMWHAIKKKSGTEVAYGIAKVTGSFYVITGATNTCTAGGYDAFAWKINMKGGDIFYKKYGSTTDEITYAVAEMPDMTFTIGGTQVNGGGKTNIWLVKIDEWGDTVQTVVNPSDENDEARSLLIVDSLHVITGGTRKTATTGALVWHPQYDYIYYPRWIWVNNVYRKGAANDSLDILGNDSNTYKLKTYLTTLKYSGIVITRFEDIVNDNYDSTVTKFTLLHALIDTLRSAGIANIICQFRSNEKDSLPTASFAEMDKLLDSLITFNTQGGSTYKTRFNGVMLDYEIWNDDYARGNATDSQYVDVVTGWQLFQQLCDSFTTASNNAANHLPTSVVWIGNICHIDTLLDLNGSGSDTTTAVDHQMMISKIDSFRFDRVVLSFFLDDTYTGSGYDAEDDPTAFLLRTFAKQENWFLRLWYFGHDSLNIPTHIIPNFHAGHESPNGGSTPKLEKYLNGTGPYWLTHGGEHYLWEAETEFMVQYNDELTFDEHDLSVDTTWGTILIDGFEWFRYNIGPLEYDSLASRLEDAKKCIQYIGLPLREQVYYDFNNSNIDNFALKAYPNPSTAYLNIKVENCNLQGNLKLRVYDVAGRDVSNSFSYTNDGCMLYIERMSNFNGIMIYKIYQDEKYIGTCKVVML